VTNAAYKDLVMEQIPELDDNQVICEPSRNNTAPCVAYTAFKLSALDPDAKLVITPADHIVLKEQVFLDKIKEALEFAERQDALVTLGIEPSRPDTGYGYIHFGASAGANVRKVLRFTEKPSLEIALQFLESGEYLWNAGIFVWSVRSVLSAFEKHSPEIYHIFQKGESVYNTGEEADFISRFYPGTPNISVDFAIMEKASNVYTIPAEFGWSDLGTWASLYEECPKDPQNNVLQGNVLPLDTSNSLIRAPEGKLVVVKDIDDYIIVDTADVLLIYPKSKEQEIKQVTAFVKSKTGERFL